MALCGQPIPYIVASKIFSATAVEVQRSDTKYSMECSIYRGSGHYDKLSATMDQQQNDSLKAFIGGYSVKFVKYLVDGKPVSYNYIGQLAQCRFQLSSLPD